MITTPVPPHLSDEERALWENAEAYRAANAAADEYAARDDDFNASEYRRVSEAAKSARLALAEAATSPVILSLLTALSTEREAGERLRKDAERIDWLTMRMDSCDNGVTAWQIIGLDHHIPSLRDAIDYATELSRAD